MYKYNYVIDYIGRKQKLLKQSGDINENSKLSLIYETAEIIYFDMAFDFIREYLNPLNEDNYDYSNYDRFSRILIMLEANTPYYYYQRIADEIQHLSYEMFLMTPYWKIISDTVKQRSNNTCKMCGSNKNLQAHHKTYDHHGFEFKYLHEDLICVCEDCHKKLHNIK